MSKEEFITLVWQMRHHQKTGQRELAEKAEKRVDEYLDTKYEQRLFDDDDCGHFHG